MAEIKLSELNLAGSELLQHSESFLDELNDREIENVVGGDSVVISLPGQNTNSVDSICVSLACSSLVTF
ncbi:MAG: hypothetical protein ACRC1Z_17480 [Waterburya sp.]